MTHAMRAWQPAAQPSASRTRYAAQRGMSQPSSDTAPAGQAGTHARSTQPGQGSKPAAGRGASTANGTSTAARNAIQGPYSGWSSTPTRPGVPSPATAASRRKETGSDANRNGYSTRHGTPPATRLTAWSTHASVKRSSGSGSAASAGDPAHAARNARQNAPPPLPTTIAVTASGKRRASACSEASRESYSATAAAPTRFSPSGASAARSSASIAPLSAPLRS